MGITAAIHKKEKNALLGWDIQNKYVFYPVKIY